VLLLSKVTGKTYFSYTFTTFTHPYFTELFKLWYKNVDGKNIKVIPDNISDLLTPIAFAYWLGGGRRADGAGCGLTQRVGRPQEPDKGTARQGLGLTVKVKAE
jgi:hypothetical protein